MHSLRRNSNSESHVSCAFKEFTTLLDACEVDGIPVTRASGIRMKSVQVEVISKIQDHKDTKNCLLTQRFLLTWADAAPLQTHFCHLD